MGFMNLRLNPGLPWQNQETVFTNNLKLDVGKKLEKCSVWSIALCGDEIWIYPKIDHQYLGNFDMWR